MNKKPTWTGEGVKVWENGDKIIILIVGHNYIYAYRDTNNKTSNKTSSSEPLPNYV